MSQPGSRSRGEDTAVVAALRAGDEASFVRLFERHRRELQLHCYRMLGSLEESEDLVQETFLRAWRAREGFEGRSRVRAWLYKIATNACLDVLNRRPSRVLPQHLSPPWSPDEALPPPADQPWLQPYPDELLSGVASEEAGPDSLVVRRETVELVVLAALQRLPPRQRAALILRDVLGWRTAEIAEHLDSTVTAMHSALQRARETLRIHLPEGRLDWPMAMGDAQERQVVRRYLDALDRADVATIVELLAEDVRATMPPYPMWFSGRNAVARSLQASIEAGIQGRVRSMPIGANRQPAAALYMRDHSESEYRPFAIAVFRVSGGLITEMTSFHDCPFEPFGLPVVWAGPGR